MTLVLTKDLSFSYDGITYIISNINLAMAEGDSLLVVGDNGSGKTTMGRLMAGQMKPGRGVLRIAGKTPSEVPTYDRCRLVSYVGQVSHLSVLTSSIHGELLTFSRDSDSVAAQASYREWARMHSLPEDTNMNPRDLSMPDLWRLVVGLYAIALRPKLLIIDEVFAAGDERQLSCARDIVDRQRKAKGATMFLYQRQLDLGVDKTVIIDNGRISEQQA